MNLNDPHPGIKRIGLAIELNNGRILQVYSDNCGGAEAQFDYQTDTETMRSGSYTRTILTDWWMDIHLTGIRQNWIKDYRPGTSFDEIEAPTRAITPPPFEGTIEP